MSEMDFVRDVDEKEAERVVLTPPDSERWREKARELDTALLNAEKGQQVYALPTKRRKILAAALAEAAQDGREEHCVPKDHVALFDKARDEGYRQGVEAAAKVVAKWRDNDAPYLAPLVAEVLALAPPAEKERT